MAAKFQYDESGGTTYYFLAAFAGIILLPLTYFYWPSSPKKEDQKKNLCHCAPCEAKRKAAKKHNPYETTRRLFVQCAFAAGWLLFAFLAYKASLVERDWVEYDPWEVLQISPDAEPSAIRRAYRELSRRYHPDKPEGDDKIFMRIAKAYAALTDEDTRRNWEEFGNPDGPTATSFGIALPSWIVDKENSSLVLLAYIVAFMVILPLVVGIWWYNSLKYAGDKVLVDTTRLYCVFINRTPNMDLKRIIMILAASWEFHRYFNPEIKPRPTDATEVPQLLRRWPALGKVHTRPFNNPFAIKTRALLLAHIERVPLPPESLDLDRLYALRKSGFLIQEMIQMATQIYVMSNMGHQGYHAPKLQLFESMMKLSQMLVQAVPENKSPLLQLPGVHSDMLRLFFVNKRVSIKSLRQLASLKDEERRRMLRNLNDMEYRNLMVVLGNMPLVDMATRVEVLDEDDKETVSAGAVVTLTVTLTRTSMDSLFDKDPVRYTADDIADRIPEAEPDAESLGDDKENVVAKETSKKLWQKPSKGGKKAKTAKPKKKIQKVAKKGDETSNKLAGGGKNGDKADKSSDNVKKPDNNADTGKSDRAESDTESRSDVTDGESGADDAVVGNGDVPRDADNNEDDDPDDDWDDINAMQRKKDAALEPKCKLTHEVHCPHYPEVKQEWYWLYVADRKSQRLVSMPNHVVTLRDKEEVRLQFQAPPRPGKLVYQVCLRSDSYMDVDVVQTIKLDVKEATKVDYQAQWDISEDEDKAGESEYTDTEDDDSDD